MQGDGRLVALSVAASAALWTAATLIAAGVSAVGNSASRLGGFHWNLDLFHNWITPALSRSADEDLTRLLPGLALSALSVVVGAAIAHWSLDESGRQRVVQLTSRIRIDPNARVWVWFLQASDAVLVRVKLTSGQCLVGQLTEYSDSPSDDVQEIVLNYYARVDESGTVSDVLDSTGILIPREQILSIERLAHHVAPGASPSAEPRRRRRTPLPPH